MVDRATFINHKQHMSIVIIKKETLARVFNY